MYSNRVSFFFFFDNSFINGTFINGTRVRNFRLIIYICMYMRVYIIARLTGSVRSIETVLQGYRVIGGLSHFLYRCISKPCSRNYRVIKGSSVYIFNTIRLFNI